jgi:hypothetical protein
MADSEKGKLIRVLQVLVPIVGVTVAVIGLFIGLAARKKELVCAYLGAEKLVSLDAGGISAAVKVEYENQAVTSLVKMRFVIRNTGSSAIKGDDVLEPISLYFPQSVKLLNSSVDRTLPARFSFDVVSNPADNTVTIKFPLLNSGDEAYFSVYTYDSAPVTPEVLGRIVDVRQIESLDDSQRQQADPFPFTSSIGVRRVLYWVVLGFNASCGGVAVGFALYFILLFARLQLWWSKWRKRFDETRKAIVDKYKGALSFNETRGVLVQGQQDLPSGHTLDYMAKQELKKQGTPDEPDSLYDNWKDLLGGTLVLSVLATIFLVTTLFMFHSPRGY